MARPITTGSPASGPRAFRAVVLALLLGVLGLASVGFAGEQESPIEAGSADPRFGVPEAHVGDRGMYEADILAGHEPKEHEGYDPQHAHGSGGGGGDGHGGHGNGHGKSLFSPGHSMSGHHYSDAKESFAYEWREPGVLYDARGVHHYTNDLEISLGQDTSVEKWEILHLDQATAASIGVTSTSDGFAVMQNTLLGSSRSDFISNWTRVYDPVEPDGHERQALCGSLTPLQGNQRNLSQPVTFPRACTVWLGARAVTVDPAIFVLDRFEDAGGVRVAVLVLAEEQPENEDPRIHKVVEYRFREDLPAPIQMRLEGPDNFSATLNLTAFDRGDRPLGTSASTQPALPPIVMVPAPAWGLDDTGVDHPYPLSTAWQDALLDPRSGLQAFLNDHPEAYTTWSSFSRLQHEAGMELMWRLYVTDGMESHEVCASRFLDDGEVVPSLPGSGFTPTTACHTPSSPVSEDHEPSLRPTAASMQAVWPQLAGLMGVETDPLDYRVQVVRSGDGDVEYFTIADALPTGKPSDSLAAQMSGTPQERESAQIVFTSEGRLDAFSTQVQRTTYAASDDQGLAASSATRPASVESPKPVGGTVFAPTAGEVSAVGGLAVGAAALYWLWPWLNQVLFAPLFSRIQKPKVLDNERRQRIAAAITAEPGIHFEELGRRTGLGRGALRHHIQMLVQNDVIGVRQGSGYTCYYPKGEVDVDAVDAQAAARSPTAQRILAAWRSAPAASGADLAECLGMSRQSVHYHVKRLRAAGLAPEGQ